MKLVPIFALAVCSTEIFAPALSENIAVCVTSNWEAGYCVPLPWCPKLVKALADYQFEVVHYLENLKCGYFKVCCGTWTWKDPSSFEFGDRPVPNITSEYNIPDDFNRTVSENRNLALNKFVLPAREYCEVQHPDHAEAELDEAPWLVNFVAQHESSEKDDYYAYCAGVLISDQHVLSSSSCSLQSHIQAVRLGQYHPRQNISSIPDPAVEERSTNQTEEIPIEKYLKIGDNIFIYKLSRKVSFNDHIRPICLPLNDTKRPGEGDLVITSGWGDHGQTLISKKRAANKIVSDQHCYKEFNGSTLRSKYTVCAQKQESSSGDDEFEHQGGGPFAFSVEQKWYLDGIISYTKDDYLVGEKITQEIFEWILDALYHFNEETLA